MAPVPQSAAIFASGIALTALLLALTVHYWLRAFGEDNLTARRELVSWALRGLLTPVLFLVLWNALVLFGALHHVVPLLPGAVFTTRQYAPLGPFFALGVGLTLLLTSSFWSAFALARLLPQLRWSELVAERKVWAVVYAGFLLPPAGLLLWWAGPAAAGFSAIILQVPVLQVLGRPKPKPILSYAKAVGRMKLGKYAEAETAVIEQLERCEDDFEGWLMLAHLYAENFRELAPAEATIRELIGQPTLTPFQVSQALNRLADWQLKLGENPPAARAALKELITRCAGTPFARTAEYRLAQLPLDREELIAQRTPRRIRLPSLSDGSVEAQPGERGSERRESARQEIDRLHVRLGLQPGDVAIRERIAVLQAEELGDFARGIQGLEALLAQTDRPPERVPVWLGHLASWHLKFRHDEAATRTLLEQILREYPDTPPAFGASAQLRAMAQRRLAAEVVAVPPPPPPRIVVRLPGEAESS